ncbi:hypothetical protein M8818_006833 [Zalaria obscura]|uniref:Uncharacterized protein n=1 Tax=Zalaria obscura TaxID=2024903 RepID=A0ACC3S509_9PEZI
MYDRRGDYWFLQRMAVATGRLLRLISVRSQDDAPRSRHPEVGSSDMTIRNLQLRRPGEPGGRMLGPLELVSTRVRPQVRGPKGPETET